jgi:hypothetical protein
VNKTKAAKDIRIHSLQEQAKKSEDGEAFRVLTRIYNCRIGVGARVEPTEKPTFFIEVLVSVCRGRDPVDLDRIEKSLFLLRQLKKRGYVLNCEEDGCISCELTVSPRNLIAESETTNSIMSSLEQEHSAEKS